MDLSPELNPFTFVADPKIKGWNEGFFLFFFFIDTVFYDIFINFGE